MISTIRNFAIVSVVLLVIFNRPNEVSCGIDKQDGVSATESQNAVKTGKNSEPDPACPDILAKFRFKGNEEDCPIIFSAFEYADMIKKEVEKWRAARHTELTESVRKENADKNATDATADQKLEYSRLIHKKYIDELNKLTYADHMKYENDIFNAIDMYDQIRPAMVVDGYEDIKTGIRNALKYDLAEREPNKSILKEFTEEYGGLRKDFEHLVKYCEYAVEVLKACGVIKEEAPAGGLIKEEASPGTQTKQQAPAATNTQKSSLIQQFCEARILQQYTTVYG